MAKKSRTRTDSAGSASSADPGGVGPRQPCPCGSGKRYKACHGAPGGGSVFAPRPFAGLAGECDIVAMSELVPSATAPATLKDDPSRPVLLCSVLPGAAPGLVRPDGAIWLGLQVQHGFGDASRDLAAVLQAALATEPGTIVGLTEDPGPGPRLQDLLADAPLAVTVHDDFAYWLEDVDADADAVAALDQANTAIVPTKRLTTVEAAYWAAPGTREFLRWVLPYDEDPLLDALARLHAAGTDRLVDGSRLIGAFRTHGLLAPVWDLPPGTGVEAVEEPAARLLGLLEEALAETGELSAEERAARAGLANRQVTIR